MNIAVRYYSRSGNTKALASAIANGASVTAVSVDEPGVEELKAAEDFGKRI